jgi:ribosomal protein S18 acetylase RimI-like enzyme
MTLRVRPFGDGDLDAAAQIHAQSFARQRHSREWISCNARAHPRARLYVADADGAVRGFILWSEKSGFRREVVLELEQIAVAATHRNQGIGEALIVQRLYRKTLGAEVEATLRGLYSGDEVLMVARKPL